MALKAIDNTKYILNFHQKPLNAKLYLINVWAVSFAHFISIRAYSQELCGRAAEGGVSFHLNHLCLCEINE